MNHTQPVMMKPFVYELLGLPKQPITQTDLVQLIARHIQTKQLCMQINTRSEITSNGSLVERQSPVLEHVLYHDAVLESLWSGEDARIEGKRRSLPAWDISHIQPYYMKLFLHGTTWASDLENYVKACPFDRLIQRDIT